MLLPRYQGHQQARTSNRPSLSTMVPGRDTDSPMWSVLPLPVGVSTSLLLTHRRMLRGRRTAAAAAAARQQGEDTCNLEQLGCRRRATAGRAEATLTLRQPICGSIVFKRLDTSPRNCTRWVVKAWDCIAPVASRGSGEGKQGECRGCHRAAMISTVSSRALQARPVRFGGCRPALGAARGSAGPQPHLFPVNPSNTSQKGRPPGSQGSQTLCMSPHLFHMRGMLGAGEAAHVTPLASLEPREPWLATLDVCCTSHCSCHTASRVQR